MKKIRYYIACCIFLALASCTGMDDIDNTAVGQNSVVISTTTGASVIVKSADTDPEQQVQWIDLFVFNNDDSKTMFYHERIDKTGNPDFGGGQFVVGKKRNEFVANQGYYVYLLANCTISPNLLGRIAALGDLQRMTQQDENLHLTGFTEDGKPVSENGKAAPELFLMDGVAYTGTSEPQAPSPVILNNGVTTENTNLSATLRRAAAKIIVNIKQGADVEFHQTLVDSEGPASVDNTGSAIYSFYQLPIDTYIITPENGQYLVSNKPVTQDRNPNSYSFIWTPTAEHTASAPNHDITIIGYAYANSWNDTEMTKETSLILNIPMKWNKDDSKDHSKESVHPNSWYKVPLSKESIFERNTCYIVNITINATGAENRSSAIDLQDIEYVTIPWIETEIKVGDNSNAPAFLMLNRDTVRIYNANVDATSLTFSSSSPITSITLENINGSENPYAAYYYNKYNEQKELSDDIKNTISATAEANVLNGGITINSPIVSATEAEINAQIAALGPVPTPPTKPDISMPTRPDGMPEEPKPDTYMPSEETLYYYVFEGSGATGTFYRVGKITGSREENEKARTATTNWRNAYSAYTDAMDEYKSTEEYKQYEAAMTEYNKAMKPYEDEYAIYQNNKANYDNQVAAIKAQANGESTHYNTIRYLEFKVTNQQGLTETFYVEQYPTIYITNTTGWYSYRDDFKNDPSDEAALATTYHTKGNRISAISYDNGEYSLHTANNNGANTSGSFWNSRVSASPSADHEGTATYNTYYWSSTNAGSVSTVDRGTANQNTRMYHIRVTSTSGEYTVGIPKMVTRTKDINYGGTNYSMTYETTDDSPANANLVSPSFMTASRLGVLTIDNLDYLATTEAAVLNEMYDVLSYHCANYVEVKQVVVNGVQKKVVYDDWRLPTEAELSIIIGLQSSNSNDATAAIDYLLNAGFYYSASGPVFNPKNDDGVQNASGYSNDVSGNTSVRCVRDAFNEPTPIGLTE